MKTYLIIAGLDGRINLDAGVADGALWACGARLGEAIRILEEENVALIFNELEQFILAPILNSKRV